MKLFISLILLLASSTFMSGAETRIATKTALANAQATAKQGDAEGAEVWLVSSNRALVGTFDWHIETAQRLMRLAYSLPRQGSMRAVPALIASALQHLTAADALALDSGRKATAKALLGNLHENFRGDHVAALASYRAAAQLVPEHPSAVRAAERLERTEQFVRSRQR